jgi:predicted extracellular nuclease
MRVAVVDATATGPTRDFPSSSTSEVPVVNDAASVRTPRGGVVIRANDFNPERLILQTVIQGLPPMNVGDRIPGATVGELDYSFGNYKLRPEAAVNVVAGGLQQEVTADRTKHELSVATFNVENLDPNDGSQKFDRLARILVANLKAPDIVALEEVQDNNGAVDDGTVASDVTLDLLVAAVENAGGPHYSWRYVAPVNNEDGGEPGGNIRVAFLFNADRVAFVDRGDAGPLTANGVKGSGPGTQLTYSPGRIDPTSDAWTSSRKPLAAQFVFRGHKVFVIANHFNSKGGDQPLEGRFQPPTLVSEVQRREQATEVRDFVRELLASNPAADVVVAGDLNDFQFSRPLGILKEAHLTALIETLPVPEQYTYDFDGNSQAIDHILVSPALAARVRPGDYDVVHVNSEFADQASDHDPQVVRLLLNDSRRVKARGS